MASVNTHDRWMPPRWLLTCLAATVLCAVLYILRELVVLIIVGYAIAFMIDPALEFLERRKIRRSFGVVLLAVTALVFISVLFITAVPTISEQSREFADNFPAYSQLAQDRFDIIVDGVAARIPGGGEKLRAIVDQGQVFGIGKNLMTRVGSWAASALAQGYSLTVAIVNLFILPFIIYYIATDFSGIHRSVLRLWPVLYRPTVRQLALKIHRTVSAYIHGQILVCTILAFLYTAGLALIGVKLSVLLGLIAGFGNIVPYVGFLVGIILSAFMALVTFGDLQHFLYVVGLFAFVQFLEGTFITPTVMGKNLGLSPLVVILAVVAGGQLLGLLGIFLAIPLVAALKVLLNHLHSRFAS